MSDYDYWTGGPKARVIVALKQHELCVGLFRTRCRCGQIIKAPHRYRHRVHLANYLLSAIVGEQSMKGDGQ